MQHRIDTRDASPIREPPCRLPLAKQQDASKTVEDMEKDRVIESSSSQWASPIVLVKKMAAQDSALTTETEQCDQERLVSPSTNR